MAIPNKSFRLAVLAAVSVFGLVAYMWTRYRSLCRLLRPGAPDPRLPRIQRCDSWTVP